MSVRTGFRLQRSDEKPFIFIGKEIRKHFTEMSSFDTKIDEAYHESFILFRIEIKSRVSAIEGTYIKLYSSEMISSIFSTISSKQMLE